MTARARRASIAAMDDARARRVAFVREHRWGLAFAIAIGLTFLTLSLIHISEPTRPY